MATTVVQTVGNGRIFAHRLGRSRPRPCSIPTGARRDASENTFRHCSLLVLCLPLGSLHRASSVCASIVGPAKCYRTAFRINAISRRVTLIVNLSRNSIVFRLFVGGFPFEPMGDGQPMKRPSRLRCSRHFYCDAMAAHYSSPRRRTQSSPPGSAVISAVAAERNDHGWASPEPKRP